MVEIVDMLDNGTENYNHDKVIELISIVSDAAIRSGCNLLEMHEAFRAVDAVVMSYMCANADDAAKAMELLKASE